MKLFLVLALALAGCAMERVIDLRPATVECLSDGKLLGAVKIDAEGKVIGSACLAVRVGPERES